MHGISLLRRCFDKTWTETDACMAENEIVVAAPREQVFGILADPARYAEWLVGTARVREADAAWPAPGARLHHSIGAGAATLDDSTEVLECEAPERLLLLARLGPLGAFRVELVLRAEGDTTHVTMHEAAVEGMSKLAGPLTGALVGLRNAMSLGRLKELAES
jgi:uncharacterized protein YndB with AHSA1/START domain